MNNTLSSNGKQIVFDKFVSFDSFLESKGLNRSTVSVTKTDNESIMLTRKSDNQPIAAIKNELKVAGNPTATSKNMVNCLLGKGLNVGIPFPGTKDNADRDALPCVMESASTWVSVSLFAE